MSQKILHLTVKKEWFDKIASGEKTVEYREFKEYWMKRLVRKLDCNNTEPNTMISYEDGNKLRVAGKIKYDLIIFRNAYTKNAPTIIAEWGGLSIVGQSNDLGIDQAFAIQIGKILEVRR